MGKLFKWLLYLLITGLFVLIIYAFVGPLVLGVEFENIERPKFNDGSYIPNIVVYEILRGSREGAKSILGKGIFKNMRKYSVPDAEDLLQSGVQGLYPNYPFNDLRDDIFFSERETEGCYTVGKCI